MRAPQRVEHLRLAAAASEISPKPHTLAIDMLTQQDVDQAFAGVERVDHLVLTAVANELSRRAPIAGMTNEQVERSFVQRHRFLALKVFRSIFPHVWISIVLLLTDLPSLQFFAEFHRPRQPA